MILKILLKISLKKFNYFLEKKWRRAQVFRQFLQKMETYYEPKYENQEKIWYYSFLFDSAEIYEIRMIWLCTTMRFIYEFNRRGICRGVVEIKSRIKNIDPQQKKLNVRLVCSDSSGVVTAAVIKILFLFNLFRKWAKKY